MKDYEKTTDPAQDAPQSVVKPGGHSHAAGHDVSHAGPSADALPLRALELSHPANAAPLAEMLTQLQKSHGNTHVQRVVAEMNDARSAAESQQREGAQSLDAGVRVEMESAFGENFDDVRVHTDSQAEKAAEELGARAFTRGRDVYFNKGEYNPSTQDGKETLAHELTHVAQNRRREEKTLPASSAAIEKEADELGRLVASGHRVQVQETSDTSAIYRQASSAPRQATPQPQAPSQTPAPPPAQAPAALTLNLFTPALAAAMGDLLVDRAREPERITLFVAFDGQHWRWIAIFLMLLFPRAYSELLQQRPAGMNRIDFLRLACNQIWDQLRPILIPAVTNLYQQTKAFQRRVDRERHRMESRDIVAPGDDQL